MREIPVTTEMIEAGLVAFYRLLDGREFEGLVVDVVDIYRSMRALEPEKTAFPRVIECKDDRDTLECSVCGRQWTETCSFDDD
jgi:hypothetical protein